MGQTEFAMKKLLIITVCLFPFALFSQLGSRNSIGTNPILANPALTGINNYGIFNSNIQFIGQDFYRANASYSTHLSSINSGLGIAVGNRQYFGNKALGYGLSYSYQTKLAKKLNVSGGISAFHSVYKFDSNPGYKDNSVTLNGGLLLYNKRLFASISLNDLRFQLSYINLSTIIGYKFRINRVRGLTFTPSAALVIQGPYRNLSARLHADKFLLGTEYRALLLGFGYENKTLGIHYIFSYNNDPLSNNYGSHRVSFQVKLPKSIQRNSGGFTHRLF